MIVGEYGQSPANTAWHIWATDGSASATAYGNLCSGRSYVDGRVSELPNVAEADATGPRDEGLRSFVEAVARTGPLLADAEDGVRAVAIADAAYEAMSARRHIRVPEIPLQDVVGPIYVDDSVANRRNHSFSP